MRSYSNSKLHPKGMCSRMMLDFPDPLDSSVIHRTAIQWSYRAYVEAKDCFTKNPNSFVLYDTLTYDDDHLYYYHDLYPEMKFHCWDYPCFYRPDIQKFMKLLRKRLHYLSFDVENNFRYLITSEYGSSEGCTHRPHYHCLFFVSFDIDPVFLSSLIHSCWPSIHDGYPDKSRLYVKNERVFRSINDRSLNVFNYVCKYITKDLYTFAKLSRRAYYAFTIAHPHWMDSPTWRAEYRRFKSQVTNFHLQSLHFGLSAVNDDEAFKRGYFCFHTPKRILQVPICSYYERKKYYHLESLFGSLVWRPNHSEDALRYLWMKLQRNSRNLAHNLQHRFSYLSFDQCFDIAQYHYVKRDVFMPKEFIGLSYFDVFKNMYFSDLPKEMRCFFHKRISFSDLHFFRAEGAFITNFVLRDIFKYKYIFNKNNVIMSRTSQMLLVRPYSKRSIGHFKRHWCSCASVPLHYRSNYNNVVCPGSFDIKTRSLIPLRSLPYIDFENHHLFRCSKYDDYLDDYFEHLRELRSLCNLQSYNDCKHKYKMKLYAVC